MAKRLIDIDFAAVERRMLTSYGIDYSHIHDDFALEYFGITYRWCSQKQKRLVKVATFTRIYGGTLPCVKA